MIDHITRHRSKYCQDLNKEIFLPNGIKVKAVLNENNNIDLHDIESCRG